MSDIERIAELALRKMQAKQSLTEGFVLEYTAVDYVAPQRRTFSPLHRAAAVVSSFRPDALRTLGAGSSDFDALLSSSAPVEGGEPGHWTLLPTARAAVLEAMQDTQQMRAAIQHAKPIAAKDDPLFRALDTLCDESASTAKLDVASLATVAPLMPSLRNALPNAPTRLDTERRLEFLRLLQPFHRLVGDHFAGRDKELQQLNDYVGVLPAGSTWEAISRLVQTRKAPLLLYGAGGVGKSTLVAKFILTYAELPEDKRFPFAYLDFDRPALLASEPATILVEAVRQIGLQYPPARSATQSLYAQWTDLLQSSSARRGPVRKQAQSADSKTRKKVLDGFVRFLSTLQVIKGPLLLVLDTFEEVQNQSDVYVRALSKFLEDLGGAVPRLRVVLSGRGEDAPGISLNTKILLNEFDEASAAGFLMHRGVKDPAVAQAIVKQVGGNPLTLHLAAAVAAGEGATKGGISDLDTHIAFGLIRVKKSHIQGQLFRRILDHIRDEDVVKIAHPGLVLRRITADLIQKVLARPCGIDVPTKKRAEELFRKLRKEVSLVSPAGEGVLEHRQDVRRLMLESLAETRPRETREIHELAAAYYAEQPGVIPRAEEIYHRLMLQEPHEEIANLFLSGVEDYLGNAIEELAVPEKAFLAERGIGKRLSPDALEGVSDQIWERTAIRRVEEALEGDDPEAALAVLAERSARTRYTLLRVHEVMALTAAKKYEDAARRASEAITAYAEAGNLLAVFEAQLADAEIARRLGRKDEALAKLAAPADIARTLRDPIPTLRVLVARGLVEETPETQRAILETAGTISDDVCREYPVLMRLGASIAMDGALMARVIRMTGLPRLRSQQQITLQEYFGPILAEETIASFVEHPPPNSARFALGLAAGILRNDTYAEPPRDDEDSVSGLRIDAKDWAIAGEVAGLNLSREELGRILASFDFSIESLTFEDSDLEKLTFELVSGLREHGRLATFIDAVRKNALEQNVDFLRFADHLGIGLTIEELRGDSLSRKFLQEMVDRRRLDLAIIESRICRVELGRKPRATGFLIGPDLVLTCTHDDVTSVRFDFGEKDGQLYSAGTQARPLRVTTIRNPQEAPLVLLHLDRPVAFESMRGSARPRARGSFSTWKDAPENGEKLVWLWAENGLRIGGTNQVIRADADQMGFPVRPRESFAGAPVFDLNLDLVAVHGGAQRRLKRECVAFPLELIAEDLLRAQQP